MGMKANIKQRKNAKSLDKPYRKKAAAEFDPEEYGLRGMIEGVYGAEETRGHRLHCRFRRDDNKLRFGMGRAIGFNLGVLNRLRCANKKKIPLPSYGKSTSVAA